MNSSQIGSTVEDEEEKRRREKKRGELSTRRGKRSTMPAKQISVLGRERTGAASIYESHSNVNEVVFVVPEDKPIDDAIIEATSFADKARVEWKIVRTPASDMLKCIETIAPEFFAIRPVILDITGAPRPLDLCAFTSAILAMELKKAKVMAVYAFDENGNLISMDPRPLAFGFTLKKVVKMLESPPIDLVGAYARLRIRKMERYGLLKNGRPTDMALSIRKLLES